MKGATIKHDKKGCASAIYFGSHCFKIRDNVIARWRAGRDELALPLPLAGLWPSGSASMAPDILNEVAISIT